MRGGAGSRGAAGRLALLVVLLLALGAMFAGGAQAKNTHKVAGARAVRPVPRAVPGVVGTTSSPLSGFPQAPVGVATQSTTATNASAAAATNTAGGSSLSSGSALAIVLGAIIVLAAIAFFIWRDARRRAPVSATAGDGFDGGRRTGSKPPPKPRKLSPAERKRRKRGRAKR